MRRTPIPTRRRRATGPAIAGLPISLWKGPNTPLFFPLDNLEVTRRAYAATPVQARHGVDQGGHTMDYVLRQGETFTRWWRPQGGLRNHG